MVDLPRHTKSSLAGTNRKDGLRCKDKLNVKSVQRDELGTGQHLHDRHMSIEGPPESALGNSVLWVLRHGDMERIGTSCSNGE